MTGNEYLNKKGEKKEFGAKEAKKSHSFDMKSIEVDSPFV
jgi:hypothetical protein